MKITLIDANNAFSSNTARLISACLKRKGFKTNLIFPTKGDQFNWHDLSQQELREISKKVKGSDLVAMSVLSVCSLKAKQISQQIKAELEIPIVWGGMHATAFPADSLEFSDFAIVGEGEEAMVELAERMEAGKDFSNIKNLCFKSKGKIKQNPLRPLIRNLDSLPFPDLELRTQFILEEGKIKQVTKEIYEKKAREDSFYLNWLASYFIHTTRGCTHSCSYCSQDMLNKMYKSPGIRKRSIDHVLGEVKFAIEKFPFIKFIGFSDDDFVAYRNKNEIDEFCRRYADEIGLPFGALVSPWAVDEYKLSRLSDAGLIFLEMGIQTGSKRTNHKIFHRPFSKEMLISATKTINKFVKSNNLLPMYDFLINNPFEGEEDLRETINLVVDIPKPFAPQMNILSFYPGTRLFDLGKKYNLLHINESEFNADFTGMEENKEIRNLYLHLVLVLAATFQNIPTPFFRALASKPATSVGRIVQKNPLREFVTKFVFRPLYSKLLFKKIGWEYKS